VPTASVLRLSCRSQRGSAPAAPLVRCRPGCGFGSARPAAPTLRAEPGLLACLASRPTASWRLLWTNQAWCPARQQGSASAALWLRAGSTPATKTTSENQVSSTTKNSVEEHGVLRKPQEKKRESEWRKCTGTAWLAHILLFSSTCNCVSTAYSRQQQGGQSITQLCEAQTPRDASF